MTTMAMTSEDDAQDYEDDDTADDIDDIDDDADKTDEELRDELKRTRLALAKRTGDSKRQLKRRRELQVELADARKPKPVKISDDDASDARPDLDTIRDQAKTEGERAGLSRAKRAEAKSALLSAGVSPARVLRAVGLLALDDLDLEDDGLDGVDDAIEDLRKEWPELFARQRQRRESVAGNGGDDSERRSPSRTAKSASEMAAARLLGRL